MSYKEVYQKLFIENDISMFEIADECYAVQNADEALKCMATATIESNKCDGVVKWLAEHYC